MNCSEYENLMIDRLAGELDEAGSRLLDTHLAHCEACRSRFAELEKVWNQAKDAYANANGADRALTPGRIDRIRDEFNSYIDTNPDDGELIRFQRQYRKRFLFHLAAAFVIATVISVMGYQMYMEDTRKSIVECPVPSNTALRKNTSAPKMEMETATNDKCLSRTPDDEARRRAVLNRNHAFPAAEQAVPDGCVGIMKPVLEEKQHSDSEENMEHAAELADMDTSSGKRDKVEFQEVKSAEQQPHPAAENQPKPAAAAIAEKEVHASEPETIELSEPVSAGAGHDRRPEARQEKAKESVGTKAEKMPRVVKKNNVKSTQVSGDTPEQAQVLNVRLMPELVREEPKQRNAHAVEQARFILRVTAVRSPFSPGLCAVRTEARVNTHFARTQAAYKDEDVLKDKNVMTTQSEWNTIQNNAAPIPYTSIQMRKLPREAGGKGLAEQIMEADPFNRIDSIEIILDFELAPPELRLLCVKAAAQDPAVTGNPAQCGKLIAELEKLTKNEYRSDRELAELLARVRSRADTMKTEAARQADSHADAVATPKQEKKK